jgi:hypothetical protein
MKNNQKKNAPSDPLQGRHEEVAKEQRGADSPAPPAPRGSDPDHQGHAADEAKPGAEKPQELGVEQQERLSRRPDRGNPSES